MRNKLRVIISTLAAIFCLFIAWAGPVSPAERIRVYNEDQEYKGYLERQFDGSIRIYDKRGVFQGKIKDNRLYDESGHLEKIFKFR